MKHTNNAMERPFFCYIVVDPPITREPAGQNALPQGIFFFAGHCRCGYMFHILSEQLEIQKKMFHF